jgi:phage N-6-adenine-methyltransferase
LNRDDAEEFSQSLSQIGEGWWRQIAWAHRQQIPESLGLSGRDWAEKYHGYLRIAVDERREAAKELTAPPEQGGMGMTQREAADVLGVGVGTINRDLVPEPVPDGTPDEPELPDDLAEETEPVPDGTPDEPELPPKPQGAHVGKNSGDNEWYTPAEYIKAAKAVMRTIDLDPASTETANEVVGAYFFYTEDDDGLTQPWEGRVWMNPPYAQPLVDRFCTRLAREYRGGTVTEACVLVNNATETGWFQEMLTAAAAVCFPRGRVKFWHPAKEAVPLQGQAIIYLGEHVAEFKAEFLRFGPVGTF